MLSKQSIRKDKKISINGASISKDDLIELSKTWTENEESLNEAYRRCSLVDM